MSPGRGSAEIDAFMAAVRLSKKQLEEVKQGVTDRQLAEHLYIIDTIYSSLEDQLLVDDTISHQK
jgi:phosphotransferase system enzyme I (PtsI)